VILLLSHVQTPAGREVVEWAAQGLSGSSNTVESVDLDVVFAEATGLITRAPAVRELRERFRGADLVVYVGDQVIFADGGGVHLRQVSTWAEEAAVPVVALAPHIEISTRELRTLGVEAGYGVSSPADVAAVVQTWLPA
jgi:hypothetical protein